MIDLDAPLLLLYTVEAVLQGHPTGHKTVVSQSCQYPWSFMTGSVAQKCRAICQEHVQVVSHGSGLTRQVLLIMFCKYTHFIYLNTET